jgi:NADP-dependent 3-hydroxy acid dehydrogenase YdfG
MQFGGELPRRISKDIPAMSDCQTTELLKSKEEAPLALSSTQESIWAASRLNPGSIANNNVVIMRMAGPLDVKRLVQAFEAAQIQHAALRTRISTVDGLPVQKVVADCNSLNVMDLSFGGNSDELESTALQISRNFAAKPIKIESEPLFHAQLTRVSQALSFLTIAIHHVISDGWSWQIILDAIAKNYQGVANSDLSSRTFRDFVLEQRDAIAAERYPEAKQYWESELEGIPTFLDIPTSKKRANQTTAAGARFNFTLNASLDQSLAALSTQRNISRFSLFNAALALTLREIGAGDDLRIAAPFANRLDSDMEQVVGLFLNTVLLRSQIAPNTTFGEICDASQRSVLNALQYQYFPIEKIKSASSGTDPSFQVMLVANNAARRTTHFGDLQLQWIDNEISDAKCELSLYFWQESGRTVFYWEYNKSLYNRDLITRITEILIGNLEQICSDTDSPVPSVDIGASLSGLEYHRGSIRADTGYKQIDPKLLVQKRSEVPAHGSVDAWAWRPHWERISFDGEPWEIAGKTVLLVRPDNLLGDTLRSAISAAGGRLIEVLPGDHFAQEGNRFTLHPSSDGDYENLRSALDEADIKPDCAVYALAIPPDSSTDWTNVSYVTSQFDQGILGILALLRFLARFGGPQRIPVFAATGGLAPSVDGHADPSHGALIGALTAAGQEMREVTPILVNLPLKEPAQRAVAPLLRLMREVRTPEILAIDRSQQVYALRHSKHRFTQDELVKATRASVTRPEGKYLIAGGLGGIGVALAEHLIAQGASSVVLVGRREPEPDVQSRLSALGSKVDIQIADIGNQEVVDALADELVSTGFSADAVFHLASTSSPRLLLGTDNQAALAGMHAKVAGSLNLVRLARILDARDLILFSSVSGATGGVGTGIYSASCSFQDMLADCHDGYNPRVRTIDWGPWRDVGGLRTANVPKDHIEAHERTLNAAIRTEDGFLALSRVMTSSEPRLIIVAQDYQELWQIGRPIAEGSGAARTKFEGMGDNDLAALIADVWCSVLGVQEVGEEDDFFDDHGGHSLIAFQAIELLGARLKKELPLALLFDNPRFHEFCGALKRLLETGRY